MRDAYLRTFSLYINNETLEKPMILLGKTNEVIETITFNHDIDKSYPECIDPDNFECNKIHFTTIWMDVSTTPAKLAIERSYYIQQNGRVMAKANYEADITFDKMKLTFANDNIVIKILTRLAGSQDISLYFPYDKPNYAEMTEDLDFVDNRDDHFTLKTPNILEIVNKDDENDERFFRFVTRGDALIGFISNQKELQNETDGVFVFLLKYSYFNANSNHKRIHKVAEEKYVGFRVGTDDRGFLSIETFNQTAEIIFVNYDRETQMTFTLNDTTNLLNLNDKQQNYLNIV